MMAFYIGIDGGGTKTTCAVGDGNALLGTGSSGGSNVVRLGDEKVRTSLQAAILSACEAAGVAPATIERTCIGVAGASVPQVREAVRRFIGEVVPGEVIVLGDNEVALEAAFGGESGVIVASGTGSIAFGRNDEGRTARAGGHGFAISDEGSGHWIGRCAVAVLMRALDRGQGTLLLGGIEDALNVRGRDQLVRVANGTPPPNFAGLFPAVLQAAESGDVVAMDVLRRAGEELAALGAIVIEKLWPAGTSVRVGMVGGVFQNSIIVREEFGSSLRKSHPEVALTSSVANPVDGALSLARKGLRPVASVRP